MAQRTIVQLVDDIDGSDATETIPFGLDGVQYEIDLHDQHAVELRAAIGNYTQHARRISGRKTRAAVAAANGAPKANGTAVKLDASNREIRDWARSNGHEVPERGRIPATIREAFAEAH
jgi:hypothetical protein